MADLEDKLVEYNNKLKQLTAEHAELKKMFSELKEKFDAAGVRPDIDAFDENNGRKMHDFGQVKRKFPKSHSSRDFHEDPVDDD